MSDSFDYSRLNDDALNALLFGFVYNCLPDCPEGDCPLADLPRDTLSSTFDALQAMPRIDKLALALVPQHCPDRHEEPSRRRIHEELHDLDPRLLL